MSYRPGFVDRAGRIYFRCPSCGDSNNPNHAHAFMDQSGSSYCFRCNESIHLPIEYVLDLMLGNTTVQEIIEEDYCPAAGLAKYTPARHTLLDTWTVPNSREATFIMYDQCGNQIGEQVRLLKGKGTNKGRSGINWPGVEYNQSLVSSPAEPLICVEGPFDVIRQNFVCMFGQITYSKLKLLRLQYVWLWPDPDILDSDQKRRKFVAMANHANNNLCNVMGLIVSEADPDESKIQAYVPFDCFNEWLEKGSGQWLKI